MGNRFFFFKQKTAYERLRSLVGSEMCIRDRGSSARDYNPSAPRRDQSPPLTRPLYHAQVGAFSRAARGAGTRVLVVLGERRLVHEAQVPHGGVDAALRALSRDGFGSAERLSLIHI